MIKRLASAALLIAAVCSYAETSAAPVLVPEPKEAKLSEHKIELAVNGTALAGVLTASGAGIEKIAAAEIVAAAQTAGRIALPAVDTANAPQPVLIVPDLGGKSAIAAALNITIPDKPESYVIKCGDYQGKKVIVLAGRDVPGLYWAAQTFRQLLSKNSGTLYVLECEISDYPDLPYRSMAADGLTGLQKLLEYKMNNGFYAAWRPDIKGKWRQLDPKYTNQLSGLLDYALPRGASINMWIEPFNLEAPAQNIQISDPADVEAYYQAFKFGLSKGNRTMTIGYDDQVEKKDHLKSADLTRFGSAPKAHAELVSRIAQRVNKEFPGTVIAVIPGKYGTSEDVKGFYDAAGVPDNVAVMWTGRKFATINYPADEVKEFTAGIGARPFIIFDNAFGGVLDVDRGPILMETYADGYKAVTDSPQLFGFHVMGSLSGSNLRVIKAMQAADFMWNARHYDAVKSRERILAKVAGEQAVEPLLAFREDLMPLARAITVDSNFALTTVLQSGVVRKTIGDDEYKKLSADLNKAATDLERIKAATSNTPLYNELKKLLGNANKLLNDFYAAGKGRLVEPSGTTKFSVYKDIIGGKFFKNYAWECPKADCVAVYGKNAKEGNKAVVRFTLEKLPAGDAELTVSGQTPKVASTIRLNGQTLVENEVLFPYGKWTPENIKVKKALFKPGVNEIELETMTDNEKNWVAYDAISLKFLGQGK